MDQEEMFEQIKTLQVWMRQYDYTIVWPNGNYLGLNIGVSDNFKWGNVSGAMYNPKCRLEGGNVVSDFGRRISFNDLPATHQQAVMREIKANAYAMAAGNKPEDGAGIPEGALPAPLTRGFFAPDGIYETAIKDMEEEREMTQLKIGIQRVEHIVFGRILEQGEQLRERGMLAENNRFTLYSGDHPELQPHHLFLRGARQKRDNDWFAYTYSTSKIAIQVVKDIRMLVAEVNGRPPSAPIDDCGLEIIE